METAAADDDHVKAMLRLRNDRAELAEQLRATCKHGVVPVLFSLLGLCLGAGHIHCTDVRTAGLELLGVQSFTGPDDDVAAGACGVHAARPEHYQHGDDAQEAAALL